MIAFVSRIDQLHLFFAKGNSLLNRLISDMHCILIFET